ncbi:patatin-like phospholipase family protein [Methylobacterium sp. J-090]|uniref:patatin-like phospholipase family protein n=1 Tax=Methylobacterium sp. J-090 TaxID=2836666 RepID=UPI001FBB0B13|nr:patatin-like phospholipase family protein [Methylobacterium sp. J-090]MCJ2079708.1 patatin-like phospholipase family protein [Methylobacterium sp. J-090]
MDEASDDSRRASRAPRTISLALQGGGSFGAFTWGVLDRLLEEDDLVIDAVSGASAGSVNAVVMAAGLIAGGRAEARRHLDRFWKRSSETAPPDFGPAAALLTDITSRWMSPYQLNPFNHDVLDELLAKAVDFGALRAAPPFRMLIAATSVADGTTRIFRETELDREMVLASGCLPLKAQAVEIEGRRYWDGGYSSNPPLSPLVEASDASEMLVVQIMPTLGQGQPGTAPDIVKRLEQITFNGVLQREMSALRLMMKLSSSSADRHGLPAKLRDLTLHHLSAEDHQPNLMDRSGTDLGWSFLLRLREAGRRAANGWLVAGGQGSTPQPRLLRSVG